MQAPREGHVTIVVASPGINIHPVRGGWGQRLRGALPHLLPANVHPKNGGQEKACLQKFLLNLAAFKILLFLETF